MVMEKIREQIYSERSIEKINELIVEYGKELLCYDIVIKMIK